MLYASELNQPGDKDGDTIIVKGSNGRLKAYKWHQREFQWQLIGDVLEAEASDSGARPVHNGVPCDYLFSVDIMEGAPLLKLPYNEGQDPYLAAYQFIKDNNLDEQYLEQVANFIVTNLQLCKILKAPEPSAEQCGNPCSVPTIDESYIPQTDYLKLEQGNISAIHEKLKEFNGMMKNQAHRLTNEELEALLALNSPTTADDSAPHHRPTAASLVDAAQTLRRLLATWPDDHVYPALDVARLAVLQPPANATFCVPPCSVFVDEMVERHARPGAIASNQMLAFRLLANLFAGGEAGVRFCLERADGLLDAVQAYTELGSRNGEIALATCILNLTIALNRTNGFLGKIKTLGAILKLLEIMGDREAVFRVLVALGTLITGATDAEERRGFVATVKRSRPVLKALRVLLDGVESSRVPGKLLGVTRQILDLIKKY